ncbi:MAG: hypothetical protein COT81_04225 [Candidatus Buchananbacteria bacterium CG10_big_fil_rev_8_21_14_0_10_42_9]|uniref:Cell shape determination protein CcmA n=1 Tax=Candidatus Buchananbacteria bacterium CG10_big_fil_rev_8_21_14_0_10_42_9 TaxID=1974526 RepID=A0A2H0W0D0_9BACT|nr:MAG: hypothetical protein COT81_04225 [Candidatus Buchananbacteria bacterium CG10_big_fil_rev_8_21_14_0_10_42_9]
MFKGDEAGREVDTVIGPSVKVEGDFEAAGNVVVEGQVTGNLKTDRNLQVGSNAKIFANVSAGSANIAGEIQGNVKIQDSLDLSNSARVFGDIKCKTASIASGAVVNGKVQIGEQKKSKPEASEITSGKTKKGKASKTNKAAEATPPDPLA